MKPLLFLFLTFFLFVSCDYGLKNGSDLEGQWIGFLGPGKNVSYIFYENGRGSVFYSAIDLSTKEAEAKSTGFTYWITEGSPYKKVHIDLDNDDFAQTYGKDTLYDYYFTNNKQRLYLRKKNHSLFLLFLKL